MKHEIIDKEITEILSDIDYDLTAIKDKLFNTLWTMQAVQVKQMDELHKYVSELETLDNKMTKLRGELKVRGVRK